MSLLPFASDFFWSWDQANDAVSLVLVESKKGFSMNVSIPEGFERENLRITVSDDVLTLTGKKSTSESKNENNVESHSSSYVSFSRSIRLPNAVDQEGITAGWNRGLLHVDLPKKEAREAVAFEVPLHRDTLDVAQRQRLDRKLFQVQVVRSEEQLDEERKNLAAKLQLAEQRHQAALNETREVAHRESTKVEEVHNRKQAIDRLVAEFGTDNAESKNNSS